MQILWPGAWYLRWQGKYYYSAYASLQTNRQNKESQPNVEGANGNSDEFQSNDTEDLIGEVIINDKDEVISSSVLDGVRLDDETGSFFIDIDAFLESQSAETKSLSSQENSFDTEDRQLSQSDLDVECCDSDLRGGRSERT